MRQLESEHQIAYFKRLALIANTDSRLSWIYAVPNGGFRNARTAKQLKAEGVKAGVPDICIPIPSGSFHGAYIEMKRPENKLLKITKGDTSKEQKQYISYLRQAGYAVAVCYGWEEAVSFTNDYLGDKYNEKSN